MIPVDDPIDEELPSALDGERLDRVVALLADVSRSDAKQMVEAGAITVDGAVERSGKTKLAQGQRVAIDVTAVPRPVAPPPEDGIEVDVVYDDDHVIVVDKPAGLVVHPGAGHQHGTLVNALLARYGTLADVGELSRPGIVHRLDAGSSGLLVVARTEAAARGLVAQFAEHTAVRRYTAVVWGHPDAAHGVIDAPIGRSPSNPLRMAVVAGARPARTEYRVLTEYVEPTAAALLDCQLETGRTHQIRVHLASIGHPLVGDAVYGERRPALGLERPFLHARELAFDHPVGDVPMRFECPLPADLQAWLDDAVARGSL